MKDLKIFLYSIAFKNLDYSNKIKYDFHCVIECNENHEIQWSHLPEELQAYFDSYQKGVTVSQSEYSAKRILK